MQGFLIIERANGWSDYTFTNRDYYLLEQGQLLDTFESIYKTALKLSVERKISILEEILYETAIINYVHTNID